MFSAFSPSKCTHTWSCGQPKLRCPGGSWGFGALLKGLTSVVVLKVERTLIIHSPHRKFLPEPRFEPTTSGYKSDAPSIRPRLPLNIPFNRKMIKTPMKGVWSYNAKLWHIQFLSICLPYLLTAVSFCFLLSFQPCVQYWPEPGLQQYGPMQVEFLSMSADEDIITRLFRVKNVTRVSSINDNLLSYI